MGCNVKKNSLINTVRIAESNPNRICNKLIPVYPVEIFVFSGEMSRVHLDAMGIGTIGVLGMRFKDDKNGVCLYFDADWDRSQRERLGPFPYVKKKGSIVTFARDNQFVEPTKYVYNRLKGLTGGTALSLGNEGKALLRFDPPIIVTECCPLLRIIEYWRGEEYDIKFGKNVFEKKTDGNYTLVENLTKKIFGEQETKKAETFSLDGININTLTIRRDEDKDGYVFKKRGDGIETVIKKRDQLVYVQPFKDKNQNIPFFTELSWVEIKSGPVRPREPNGLPGLDIKDIYGYSHGRRVLVLFDLSKSWPESFDSLQAKSTDEQIKFIKEILIKLLPSKKAYRFNRLGFQPFYGKKFTRTVPRVLFTTEDFIQKVNDALNVIKDLTVDKESGKIFGDFTPLKQAVEEGAKWVIATGNESKKYSADSKPNYSSLPPKLIIITDSLGSTKSDNGEMDQLIKDAKLPKVDKGSVEYVLIQKGNIDREAYLRSTVFTEQILPFINHCKIQNWELILEKNFHIAHGETEAVLKKSMMKIFSKIQHRLMLKRIDIE